MSILLLAIGFACGVQFMRVLKTFDEVKENMKNYFKKVLTTVREV